MILTRNQAMEPQIINYELIGKGEYVQLERLYYLDAKGVKRNWETVRRANDASAVIIIATITQENKILLVKQFRPPLGKYVLEFPAGLVDQGESPEKSALRELKEETGYQGSIEKISCGTASSAGLTSGLIYFVSVNIDNQLPENVEPSPDMQDGEDIITYKVKKSKVNDFIKEQIKQGVIIDSRLNAWILGRDNG